MFVGALSGNASTATKLTTARTINGTSFDGSANIKIGLDSCRSYSPSSNYASYPWFKIASVSATTTSNNYNLTLYVSKGYGNGVTSGDGILKVYFRTSSTAGKVENCTLKWQFASSSGGAVGIKPDNFVMVYTNDTTNGKATAELWVKHTQQWESWHFKVLHSGTQSSNSPSLWTLYSSTSGSASYTSGTGTVVSSFSTLQNGLSDTGWITLADNVKYRKIGNIVEVRGTYTAPNSGGGMTIGTLPSGYRPSNSSVYNTNSINSTASNIYYTSVSPAGVVVISGMSGSTFTKDSTYNVNIMFMVG